MLLGLAPLPPTVQEGGRRLLALVRGWRRLGPGTELFAPGAPADLLFIIRRGWSKRTDRRGNGRERVLDLVLPGEVVDFTALAAGRHDHGCITLTEAEVGTVDAAALLDRLPEDPALERLAWWLTLQQADAMRRRVLMLGTRSARERLCLLLLELHRRLRRAGQATGVSFPLPIPQRELAQAAGLTPVHTSRTLRALEADGIARLERGSARIADPAALERESGAPREGWPQDGIPHPDRWPLNEWAENRWYLRNSRVEKIAE